MLKAQEMNAYKLGFLIVGRGVAESIFPPQVGSKIAPPGKLRFYSEVNYLLEEIAKGHGVTPDQVKNIKGRTNIRPVYGGSTAKQFHPYIFFGSIVAETIVGGVPPRAFYWKEKVTKTGPYYSYTSGSTKTCLTEVWPLQPAVFAEDVEAVDAKHDIKDFLFTEVNPDYLESNYRIVVLEANDIESGVGAYIAIPQKRDDTKYLIWRLGVLGDYMIDPDLASRMNDDFEARMKELEAEYL